MPSASAKCRLPQAALAAEPDARVAGTGRSGSMPTTSAGFLGERQRHAAAAAAGVEHAAAHRHAGALEKRDDLGAAVVLEQRVVVFGAEPQVGVRLDGALVNRAHAPLFVDRGAELVDSAAPVPPRFPRRRTS